MDKDMNFIPRAYKVRHLPLTRHIMDKEMYTLKIKN